jgi:methionine--tRNA ligase beta chain
MAAHCRASGQIRQQFVALNLLAFAANGHKVVRLEAFDRKQKMENPTPQPLTINYDDFAKLDLRVATVLECKPHANADKLLVLQIELGTEKRQICAGLRQHIADPQSLVGKQIVVVANLAPRQMRGEISQGMLLAATDLATGKVIVVTPSEAVAAGSKVS